MSSLAHAGAPAERRLAFAWLCLIAGLVVASAAVVVTPAEGWAGLLTAAVFGTSLALGGAIFLAIQLVSGARWWLPLRPVPLLLARTLAVPLVALAPCLLLGREVLYPWARAGAEASPLLAAKAAWLEPSLFLARALVVALVWLGLIETLHRRLQAVETEPTPESGCRAVRAATVFLVLLGPTLSVAAWDWTMSLEPEWYSTMHAVYLFAGAFLGGIAAVTLLALLLEGRGLPVTLSPDVRHDLGKLLFAFSTFWAYIWFCQYLLIWYANLPEETPYYAARFGGGWSTLFWLNPLLNWVVPFVALLSVSTKRRGSTLSQVALVVLAGRWLDAYLLVGPSTGPAPVVPAGALAATLAVLAGMGLVAARRWRSATVSSSIATASRPRFD